MRGRTFVFVQVASAACLSLACGSAPENAAPEAAEEAAPISGMYSVEGVTTETGTGHQRRLAGTIILAEDGVHYTATFSLTTTFPGGEQGLPAEVIGQGEGSVAGRTLKGTNHTQLVVATVPGVDPGFAFIPRRVSTRIVSTSVTRVAPDGSVEIELANAPETGEDYAPTRTVLHGRRVSTPNVASGPRAGS